MKTKWLYLTMLIGCGGLFLFLSFGLSFLYQICNNNIVLFQSALPELLNVLYDLIEILAWAIAISLLAYAIFFRLPKQKITSLAALLCGLLLLRRIFDLWSTLIVNQVLSLSDDIIFSLILLFIDLIIFVIAYALTSSTAQKYYRHRTAKNKAKSLFQNTVKVDLSTEDFYPFKKIFSKKNPLQVCLLKISVFFSASQVIDRFIYDFDAGAPKDVTEGLIMAIYYLSDLLLGIIFYIFCILIFRILFKKMAKKKLDDVK